MDKVKRSVPRSLLLAGFVLGAAVLTACGGGGGGGGGSIVVPPPTRVDGQCGAAVNQCTAGWLNDLTDTDTEHRWLCNGQNGGTIASCAIPKPPAPVDG